MKERFKISTLEIAGFVSVLAALRLPFGKEMRSEAEWSPTVIAPDNIQFHSSFCINEKDLQLMSTLIKRGDEHAKAIRGLQVYAVIEAPRAVWQEIDTYRIGTDRLSSESTMHTIGKGNLSIRDFDVPEIIYDMLDPQKEERIIQPLIFEDPEELKSVVKTYGGREYEIWNNGDIFSLPYRSEDEDLGNGKKRTRYFEKKKIKTGITKNQQGYYQVRLGGKINGKTYSVHRIMAEAFCSNPNQDTIVNHIDGNKGNCSPSNLEWCTSSENSKHAFDTGLREVTLHQRYLAFKNSSKWSDVDIKKWQLLRKEGKTLKEIAELYNVDSSFIWKHTEGKLDQYDSEFAYWFRLASIYEQTINSINELASTYQETGDFKYVQRIKELLPESFIQKRIQVFSYQTLRRIYFQRRNHRLPVWHQFCEWIESLPFAEELITIEKDEK